ncbi:MAG: chemotaxis protein CheA [Opitutaceae bacterium]|nr:chemotaxis protein CheA [Opitutaceae bacterium]
MQFDEIQRRSREIFRLEAADVLTELEAALLELERDPANTAAIDRVFRAMHTLKGSGATSGFTDLSGFLHHVEDVFNAAREGRLAINSEILDLTLRLCDVIARYLEASPAEAGAVLTAAEADLQALLRHLPAAKAVEKKGAAGAAVAVVAAPVVSVAPPARPEHRYTIRFHPHPGVFQQGVDPGMFLDGLRGLGPCEVRALSEALPALAELDAEQCYLGWEILLATTESESTVRDVFLFVADACDLEITTDVATAPVPAVDPAAPSASAVRGWLVEFQATPGLLSAPGALDAIFLELSMLGQHHIVESPPAGDEPQPGRWRLRLETEAGRERIGDAFAFAIDAAPVITPADASAEVVAIPAPGAVAGGAAPVAPTAPRRPAPAARRAGGQPVSAAAVNAKHEMLRVSADKLDRLVNLVGELVILKSQVSEGCALVPNLPPALQGAAEGLQRLAFELRDVVLGVRMMPIGETFAKFRRLTRDLSRDLGKEVELVIEGAETEMDKTVLDQLTDPLMHLVRNCLDHGCETPDERERAGKPRTATLTLRAEQRGDRVWIVVADDGRGLDAARIRTKAIARGLLAPEATPSEQEIYQFIMLPGFSTADKISEVSGRGVGLDVVKRSIEALRGTVELRSQPGRGAEIRLSLPLTLAIIEGLMVRVANDRYILPLSCALETIEQKQGNRLPANGRNVVALRGELLPYLRLRELFDYPGEPPEIERIVVVELEDKRIGIAVDEVLGNHQTVLKSLGWLGQRVDIFTGATVLGDGKVAMIIDVSGLVAYDAARLPPSNGLGSGAEALLATTAA